MTRHDVDAVWALCRRLEQQSNQPAMQAIWFSSGGLIDLMRFHREEFNIGGAEDFVRRRLECAEHFQEVLQEKRTQHGDPEDDRELFLEVRQDEWMSNEGHLPNRARFVLNFLDEQQKQGQVSMLKALSELCDVLKTLLDHLVETTGPPEPRVHRVRSSATC